MAKDKRRIMQNRAKKKARAAGRKKRRRQPRAGGSFADLGCTRAEVGRLPIHAVYVAATTFAQGLGHVIIARRLPDGRIIAGVFLIDAYCLGVKNAFLMVQSPIKFEDIIETEFEENDLEPAPAPYARKLVDDSIAYARDLGFEPHRDFRDAEVVLGDIDPTECSEEFVFGHEGKPFYISGPHHSEATARRIIAQLQERCGPGGSHYLIEAPDGFPVDSLDFKERVIEAEIVEEDGPEIA